MRFEREVQPMIPEHYKQLLISIIHHHAPQAIIYLFGSRARGTHTSGADVDLALDAGVALLSHVFSTIKEAIEISQIPYVVDLIDIHACDPLLRNQILQDGILWNQPGLSTLVLKEQIARNVFESFQVLASAPSVITPILFPILRDAYIKRFEYVVDTHWKYLKEFLRTNHGYDLHSPKDVFRACFRQGLLSEKEIALVMAMIDDRLLTTFAYKEEVASHIYAAIPGYLVLIGDLFARIQKQSANDLVTPLSN